MPGDITLLIAASQEGDDGSHEKLFRVIAPMLRKFAAIHLKDENQNHTLGIDGIVTDTFLKLVELNRMEFNDRDHFFALANTFMKRRLDRYRRWKAAKKRGGDVEKLPLEEELICAVPFAPELGRVREAVDRMGKEHPRQTRVLELYYFYGYRQAEIAEQLQIGERTIQMTCDLHVHG